VGFFDSAITNSQPAKPHTSLTAGRSFPSRSQTSQTAKRGTGLTHGPPSRFGGANAADLRGWERIAEASVAQARIAGRSICPPAPPCRAGQLPRLLPAQRSDDVRELRPLSDDRRFGARIPAWRDCSGLGRLSRLVDVGAPIPELDSGAVALPTRQVCALGRRQRHTNRRHPDLPLRHPDLPLRRHGDSLSSRNHGEARRQVEARFSHSSSDAISAFTGPAPLRASTTLWHLMSHPHRRICGPLRRGSISPSWQWSRTGHAREARAWHLRSGPLDLRPDDRASLPAASEELEPFAARWQPCAENRCSIP